MITRKILFFICFAMMVTTFLPILARNLPPIIRSHHLWAILWLGALIALAPRVFKQRLMQYALIYAFFSAIMLIYVWTDISTWDKRSLFYQVYYVTFAVSIMSYFYCYQEYRQLAMITKWALIFIFITAVLSIFTAFIDPLYARKITGLASITDEVERERLMSMRNYGGGAYEAAISFMALIPVLVYFYKNNQISLFSKKTLLLGLGIMLFALVSMQLFANILIGFITLLLALLGAKKFKKSILIGTLLLIIISFLPSSFYSRFFLSMASLFESKAEVSYKFTEMAEFTKSGISLDDDTAFGSRGARYPQLLAIFFKEPLFGSYSNSDQAGMEKKIEGGGHLFWMYKLTTTGFFAFFFFFLIPFKHFKFWLKSIDNTFKFYYFLSTSSILIYGLLKNIAGRDPWYVYFIIIPGVCFLPELIKKKAN